MNQNTNTDNTAPCSALEFLAAELEMPADHIRESAKAMREERLAKTADELHGTIFTMLRDWRDGDFKLPPLAKIHMEAIEVKAVELGKVLFRRQNVNVDLPDTAAQDSASKPNSPAVSG